MRAEDPSRLELLVSMTLNKHVDRSLTRWSEFEANADIISQQKSLLALHKAKRKEKADSLKLNEIDRVR